MTTFGRAVPDDEIEWNWRDDGFTWTLYDRKDDLGWSERRVNLHVGPRLRLDWKWYRAHADTEWGPIDNEPERMEPTQDYYWRQWNLPLFGWGVTLTVTVYS